ncbi:MAG TPA: prepilin-type N-terminal cleavage/methylation domain-containing protein [Opitutaceae bacterium]|nr:prepilin-type N-terminal cleavage/methylation domain-containing protein [Opitutaceae bacterium]
MHTPHIFRSRRRSLRGMTLVEVMMASAISLIVTAGVMWLVVEGMRASIHTSNVSGNDLDHWGLANRLVFDTRLANKLILYSEFSSAAVSTEGNDGVADAYAPEPVGNFLVLALRLPDEETGVWACTKLTGYVYNPDKKTLSKFEYSVDKESDDYKKGTPVPDLITKHFSELTKLTVLVASDLEIPSLAASATTKAAFYQPIGKTGTGTNKAILRMRLGMTNKHWRVRDSRLIEVAFYIRS